MTALHTPEQLYQDADELLLAAEFELHRAEEDMVTHLVCNHARLSISHYMIGYLLEHAIPILPPASIASLQHQCQDLDPRFHLPDLDRIECRYETPGKRYCLEVDKVTTCFKAAQTVREIIKASAH